jgi:hypothetical protein
MIEDDERSWKAQDEAIIDRVRTNATKQYISAILLAIALTPAIVEGLTLGFALMTRRSHPGIDSGPSLTEFAGTVFAFYFVMLIWSLPVLVPAAVGHVVCAHLLRRRGRLNWLTASASGALHGVLAILLFGAIYGSSDHAHWLSAKPSALAVYGFFALDGVLVALALHAAFPIFRRRWGVTAP